MSKDYKVGYGKPPKKSQFKPGQSGNPKGRPKGTKDLKTELVEELAEKISLKEDGKLRKVSKQRAMLKALMARAVNGDVRAINSIMNMVARLVPDEPEKHEGNMVGPDDMAIVEAFLARSLSTEENGSNDHDA